MASRYRAIPNRHATLPSRISAIHMGAQTRDQRREALVPWRKWYHLKRWKDLSLKVKAKAMFTCQWPGCGHICASPTGLVADHITPHHGDEALFWDEANLQCLCKPCHDIHKQRAERTGGGAKP